MKVKLTIVISCLAGGLLFLLFSTSSQEAHPHYMLPEFNAKLKASPTDVKGLYMTVYGNVKEGSIERTGIKADFVIEMKGHELPVHFTGKTLLPDTFKPGAEASVDGTYDAKNNVFIADKVLAKCASKYDAAAGYKKK